MTADQWLPASGGGVRKLTITHHEETFGDNGTILYLSCDGGYTGVYSCQIHMYTLKWVHIIVSKSYLNKVGLERKKKLHNSTCYDEPTCVKQKNNIHIFAFLCMQRRHLERYTRNLLVIRTWDGRVRRRLLFSYTLLFLTTCLY